MLTQDQLLEYSDKLVGSAQAINPTPLTMEEARSIALQLMLEVHRLHQGLKVLGKEAEDYAARMEGRKMWAEHNLAVYWKNKFLSLIGERAPLRNYPAGVGPNE